MRTLFHLCVLCALCGKTLSDCHAEQNAIALSGERFSAELSAIDAEGQIRFQSGKICQLGELVRWGHPVTPKPQPVLVLADGSRLVAAASWTGEAPVILSGDEFMLKSNVFQDIRVPRQWVREWSFAERQRSPGGSQLPPQLPEREKQAQDEVLLTNDDRLLGRVAEVSASSLTLATASDVVTLPLGRVQRVLFADAPKRGSDVRAGKFLVGTRDGSLLVARSIRAGERELQIQLAAGDLQLAGGRASDVVFLQLLGGEKLAYLSDLEAASYRHVPYLSIEWPYRRDQNVRGGPLVVKNQSYGKGIGMYSASRLTYTLDPSAGWRRFAAEVAIDDAAGGRGSVTVGVHVLRGGQWQAAYTSGILRGGESPVDVSVDVRGAAGLTLTVDYAERGDELDYADWLDARLVK